MSDRELVYKPYGDRAILIQWPDKIDENLLEEVLFCKKSLEIKYPKLILEVVSSYNSLLIYYMSTIDSFYSAVLELKKHFSKVKPDKVVKKRLWTIPVCYDEKLAIDSEVYCSQKKLTKQQLIALHSDVVYTVYFIGFLPGFLYLGGLDEQLFMPRKERPSLQVPKGAVAIGGQQTGIYPQDSPGGWYVIGRSPLSFFDVKSIVPCFVSPGDKVKFESVSVKEYNAISSLVVLGVFVPKSEWYDG